jgi:hypothetical protein
MKPYVLAAPDLVGNNIVSGGIRVMWGLYGWLLAKGQLVWMNRFPDGDNIAIYPEIYYGNPLNGKTVVRYILNVPGTMGHGIPGTNTFKPGPTEFDKTDKLYYFSRMFGETDGHHYLFLPIANLHIFKDQHKVRNKTCYLIGKGSNKLIHPKDSIELTRQFALDQQALADLLNECETLYCYDKLSAMMEIARLCGCRVKYYGGHDEYELQRYEPGLNGIGFMGDDVKLDTELFREHYVEMTRLFSDHLDQFIEDTQ